MTTPPLDLDGAWLAIIDMQKIFAHPGKWWGCPEFKSIVTPISQLAARFGDRTLLTRSTTPGVESRAMLRWAHDIAQVLGSRLVGWVSGWLMLTASS